MLQNKNPFSATCIEPNLMFPWMSGTQSVFKQMQKKIEAVEMCFLMSMIEIPRAA